MILSIFLLFLATSFQLGSLYLVLKLIPITQNRSAWSFISTAMGLMIIRRLFRLFQIVYFDLHTPFMWLDELFTFFISFILFIGFLNIIPLFLNRNQLIEDLESAISEVKTLHGLIPICSSCKKIRDDQGYWRQVETYIHEHSNVEFTHGLCPDCIKKIYPEYDLEDSPVNPSL